jgi:hypothetical protein
MTAEVPPAIFRAPEPAGTASADAPESAATAAMTAGYDEDDEFFAAAARIAETTQTGEQQ